MAKDREPIQELYFHLDATGGQGDRQIAWYGQLRAKGESHAEALENTIVHFRLRDKDWYNKRMDRL